MHSFFKSALMMKYIFFALTILFISCSDPIANKSNETTFESDVRSMVESGVLTKEDARKIRCAMYLGAELEKDLSLRSYKEILSSFDNVKDDLSFSSMSKVHSKLKLDRALTCELFKVQRKPRRGRVYFGFKLKNETDRKVIAYAGIISISDLFGKPIYTGPFENQRKHIAPFGIRELWVKIDKSNARIKLALKEVQCNFKWESQVVIYEDGKSLNFEQEDQKASEEFENELKSLYTRHLSNGKIE
jgi:hypothetical protein